MSSEKNIIKVYFKGTHLTHSKTQYQYNHGMVLHFADLNLPQAFETHFANKQHGNSKTVIGSENKVEIPDEYFWTGANEIYAWVYLHSDVDDGETVYEVRIPLVKRAKPSDEEPLPEQQSAIDRAIAELNHAVEITNADAEQTTSDRETVTALRDEVIDLRDEAEQSAQTATAKANEANESASSASESEQNAHDYADDAKRYAENAFSSKETAVASASDAEQAKEDAEQARDDAQDAKSDAIQIKQDVVGLKDDVVNLKDDVIVLKEQTDTNVTHYPKVIDEYWHVWNASLGEYVNTNVKAQGEKGDKGDTGNNGVYIGEDEPTDDEINVWIDIDDEDVFVGLKYIIDDPSNNYGVIEGGVIADVSQGLYINQATGLASHAEGTGTVASGGYSHSEGGGTTASGDCSHAEGGGCTSSGKYSHTEGYFTLASSQYQHVQGKFNIEDDQDTYAFIIGNGTDDNSRSNALTLDWDGNLNLSGKATVATAPTNDNDVATKKYVDDSIDGVDILVNDVQIDGTSIITNGVANVPIASNSVMGVAKFNVNNGVEVIDNIWRIVSASSAQIKGGAEKFRPVTPHRQHESAFYGLAKAAGDTTQSQSSNEVGQYTEEAKQAIREMLGIPNPNGELIADITTEEDLASLWINTSLDGQPFELSKAILIITAPPATTGVKDTLYGQFRYKDLNDNSVSDSFSAMSYQSATSSLVVRGVFDTYNGCMPITFSIIYSPTTGNSANIVSMPKTDIAKCLTGFRIYQQSTHTLLPSGTNIKLYGIRV